MTRGKSASSATGAKMLVTAVSIASVFGGWVWFTLQQSREAQAEETAPQPAVTQIVETLPTLPPLPTLVPERVGVGVTAPAAGAVLPGAPALPGQPAAAGLPLLPTPQIAGLPGSPSKDPNRADGAAGSNRPEKAKPEKPKSDGGTKSSR